eukprot:Em0011g924a
MGSVVKMERDLISLGAAFRQLESILEGFAWFVRVQLEALVTSTATPPPVTITGLVPRTTYTSVTAYTITGPGTQVQTSTADISWWGPIAMPPVTITGLVPTTTYTYSVTAYTITGPGTLQQVQTSTADIPLVTSTSITVMWSQPGGEIGTTYTPIATPPVTITGLVPTTTYTFSVTAYTITGPGTPQQVQTSTADIREHFSVYLHKDRGHHNKYRPVLQIYPCDWCGSVSHQHNICLSVLAGCPAHGILTGYTVYYLSLPNTSKRQSGGYTSHTFPPTTTSGDINNLNPNGVYQFSVVAQVTIMGQLYSGEMDTTLVNTPTITPGIVAQIIMVM